MTTVIQLDDVSLVRGSKPILDRIHWSVEDNQRWVIIGPNGAGKTSLLRILAAQIQPTTGTAEILGERLGKVNVFELRTRIGFASSAQAAHIPNSETVLDAIMTATYAVTGRWNETYEDIDERRARRVLAEWHLQDFADRAFGTLSDGERKRAQIARAVMTDPELLLLDEPVASLDLAAREQTVQIHPISAGNNLWKPSPKAEVLLLGDSFSNIYSLGAMGWGEGAGLAEHLSSALGKPVDAILQNSDGAFAARQILQREMAAGRDRLKEKKVVIWEFAVRELAFGDWKLLTLALGERSKPSFYSPEAQRKVRIEGTVSQLSSIPRPGNVPYKEHIACMQLVDVKTPEADPVAGRECLVYTWSMKDQKATAAARLRVGDRVTLEVQPWEDVVETNEKFQRSELDGPALLAEPFTWSESVERSGGQALAGAVK